jgi:uncharacterized lipoprotein YmbA
MRMARDVLDPGRLRQVAAAGMTILLAACGSTPKEAFYTLASAPPVESTAAATMTVHVGPVAIPDEVDRTPMVIRKGPNEVAIEDFHRWAEPLKTAIPRALAANLARELGGARVSSGRLSNTSADYRVAVDVSRFESSFAEGATLEAAWTVTPKSGPAITGRTLARVPAASADYAGVAGAHSRALEQLAREVGAVISRRPSSPAPSARGG